MYQCRDIVSPGTIHLGTREPRKKFEQEHIVSGRPVTPPSSEFFLYEGTWACILYRSLGGGGCNAFDGKKLGFLNLLLFHAYECSTSLILYVRGHEWMYRERERGQGHHSLHCYKLPIWLGRLTLSKNCAAVLSILLTTWKILLGWEIYRLYILQTTKTLKITNFF